ncbi:MAG TPA: response regulator transcription factor [Acidimicrobiia bacterium]|nr:response regulator transcription factor [Acidimicrobiia bacterium]
MTRVGIADDQALVRAGLETIILHTDGLELVGEATNGLEAVELARNRRPDVLLMDIRMPLVDGIEATRRIVDDSELADVRVLILTTFDADEYVYAALRAGASGFLLKDVPPEELVGAIRVVAEGEALLAPSITRRLISEFAIRPSITDERAVRGLDLLTGREREIMVEVGRGLSNAEIANALVVSHATVKTHVSRILTKLGARDRAQLVVLAYESGLVIPGR